jgi:hypothetical protein
MSTSTNPLVTKAVVASLSISAWTARKFDRKVTDETNKRNNAGSDAGRYNKLLIAKEGLETLNKIAGQPRSLHYTMTQPWLDDGARVLPTALYIKYMNELRKLKQDFEAEAEKFALNYPSMIEDAKSRLNGMFNEADYPPAAMIRGRFDFDIKIFPAPSPDDFRVSIASEHLEEVKADIEARMREALDSAMRDARDRVVKVVGHMAERLKAYRPATEKYRAEGIFHDSLVENVRELVGLLPAFNLTGDKAFAKIIAEMDALCVEDAASLRDKPKVRKEVAAKADEILSKVSAFMA